MRRGGIVKRPRLTILLGPSRLELVDTRSGTGVATPLDPSAWESTWEDALRPLDEPLRQALQSMGASQGTAAVFHAGPDRVCEVFSCPVSGSAAQNAASLALADLATGPLEDAPHAIVRIGSDQSGERRQTHSLIAADSEQATNSIAQWLSRAGLRAESIIPIEASLLANVVEDILSHRGSETIVRIRVGEFGSVLAAGANGRLLLIRKIGLSIELLADALARPIHRKGNDAPVTLSRDEVRTVLFETGIPKPEDVVDQARAITGLDILPLLQPVLQRAIVEAKQSLRFGLPEAQRASASFVICGPGAAIPRLHELIAEQTSLSLNRVAAPTLDPNLPGCAGGDLHLALEFNRPTLNLLPRALRSERAGKRLRRALVAGSVAAALVATADGLVTSRQLESARAEAAAILANESASHQGHNLREQAAAWQSAINNARNGIDHSLGLRSDWEAVLKELSFLTPDSIRLLDISGASTSDKPQIVLQGYALRTPSGPSVPDFAPYIQAVSQSPLVADVAIGATQRTTIDNLDALRFSATVTLVGLPPQHALMEESR